MQRLLLPICAIVVALAIPIVPWLVIGFPFEMRLEETIDGVADPATAALLVVGLLSADVFLPIPSSLLSTLGGEVLGFVAGTAASFAGLMLGAVFGFGLARMAGRPLMTRLASPADIERIDRLSERMGPALLMVTRPIPVFAEAAVLFFGATGLSWRRFLPPVAATNLAIAGAYSALGSWVHLPAALALSIILPVAATWFARRTMGAS